MSRKGNIEDIYPLTPMQEGMLFHWLSAPTSSTYFDQLSYRLHGELHIDLVKKSLNQLVRRYDILRTAFIHEGVDRPVQVVLKHREVDFYYEDLRENPVRDPHEKEAFINAFKEKDRERNFDLTNDVLMRVAVLQIHEQEYEFIWSHHHILMDGWCTGILIADYFEIYTAYLENRNHRLAAVTPYRAYIQWLEKQDREKSATYWQQYLEFYEEAAGVPGKNAAQSSNPAYKNEQVFFAVNSEKTTHLNHLAAKNNVTLNTVIQAAWGIVLARYNSKEDVVFAAVVSGRPDEIPAVESMVGLFINTIPVRIRCRGNIRFNELLPRLQQKAVDSEPHHYYPLAEIQAQSTLKQNLLDHILVFENFPIAEKIDGIASKNRQDNPKTNVHLARVEAFEQTNYDFNMIIAPGGRIYIRFLYNGNIYDKNFVERIPGHFTHVIEQILSDEEITLSQLTLLTGEERKQLLSVFNDTRAEYPKDHTIHQLFEEQAANIPDSIAIVGRESGRGGSCTLTYKALNEKSNRLARLLRARGVGPDSLVGLLMERSPGLITGMLAIMKAGGAYLPLDPGHPQERLLAMIEDSGLSLLLTTSAAARDFSLTSLKSMNASAPPVEPFVTPPRQQIKDFDQLPKPNRTLINYEKYHPFIGIAMARHTVSLQATRGCPFNCAFCHKIWPRNHVSRSAENIFAEILYCYKAGLRRFVFIDDVFNLDKKNSSQLLKKIIRNHLDIQLFFPNGLRGDILDKHFIDLMIEAGTVNIDLALESASPRIQQLIKKNLHLDKFRDNIRYINETYPRVLLEMELMIGFPTETEEEALMTLDFLKDFHWVHFPNLNILKIYPNTDMAKLAVENGIDEASLQASANLAYHELPETLPFEKSFVKQYQTRFMEEYILSKDRLLSLLPLQMKTLTEDELVQKYDSYLPVEINRFDDILQLAGITRHKLGKVELLPADNNAAPGFDQRIQTYFPSKKVNHNAMRVLLVDLTLLFSDRSGHMMYDMIEEPLGLMYLMSYLDEKFGRLVLGKIAKSRIDFDSYEELKTLIADFKPDLIGIRTLSFYREFFHESLALIRQWGVRTPIAAGGPYATSDYRWMLRDTNLDLAVLGEGEYTLAQLIEKMLQNDKKLPGEDTLKQIHGLAFIKNQDKYRLQEHNREILLVDQLSTEPDCFPPDNIGNVNQPGDLIYVIYTSGSTGKPKGVMLEHRNLVNLARYNHIHTTIDYTAVLQFATIAFDASFQEIFFTLTAGGKLLVIDEQLKTNIPALFRAVTENRIKTLFLPISLLKIIFSQEDYIDVFPQCITHIQTAGEQVVISKRFAQYLKAHHIYLHNHYGPAETHVATAYTVDPAAEVPELPSIGTPVSNTNIYILDPRMNPQPIGVPGELFIGGIQVGRGYLDRPELTAEKFVLAHSSWLIADRAVKEGATAFPMSYELSAISSIYKTGDLAKWLPDGNIDFLGRIDHQVKIRGFRIEPGEIESRLSAHPLVKETVVIPFEKSAYGVKKGEKFLCAYIVPDADSASSDLSALREYLSNILPDYMVPSYFVSLEKIPLTPNGKVNRQALPDPGIEGVGEFAAPRNELERKLQIIWSKVLGIDKNMISIDANFFQLGGHSLKAIILVSRIKKEWEIEFSLGQVFQGTTIRKFAEMIKGAKKSIYEEIKAVEKREYYPQSSSQRRMFFLEQYEKISTTYNLPLAFEIRGKLEKERYENAFKMLIRRHETLRTSFELMNNEPRQRIHDTVDIDIEEMRIPKENITHQDIRSVIKTFIRPFDLLNAPLLRAALVPLQPLKQDSYLLLFDMHHIISDGTSLMVLMEDFIKLYALQELPPIKIQYKDFSQWQNSLVQSKKIKEQEDYWLNLYQAEIPRLNLPLDYPRPNVISFAGDSYNFKLPAGDAVKFKKVVSDHGTTVYMSLLTVFNILLYKYTRQEDIIVGCGIVGRPHVDLEAVIGLFVNTLAMRNYPKPTKTSRQFLKEVKENSIKAFENQDVQFEDLVDKLNPQRNPARNPLFDVLFVFQNFESSEKQTGGVSIVPYAFENNTSKFDLMLTAFETKHEIQFNLEFCTDLYRRDTIERLAGHFIKIIAEIIEKPMKTIGEIELLSPSEKKMLIDQFNATAVPYPRDKTIHELFEHQVEKTTDHVALLGKIPNPKSQIPNKISITYRELNKQSHQLAHLLKEKGVRAEEIVGIMGDRSVEIIIGILGILKAGAAYMPIDPDYPQERKQYMLKDSGAKILLTSQEIAGFFSPQASLNLSDGRLFNSHHSKSLAYIMYTSGSTGGPKGVMVRHRNVARLVKNANYVELSENTRILQTGTPVFDATTLEIWGALLNGGQLVLVDKDVILDAGQLNETLKKHHVNVLWLTAPLFNQLADQNREMFSGLDWLLVGGDVLSPRHINMVKSRNRKLNLVNGYGPTENTTFSTTYLIDKEFERDIPIGNPINNSTVYILDNDHFLQPVGVVGELCVGGDGVSRGYLNNPELTCEKFCLRRPGGSFCKNRPLDPHKNFSLNGPDKDHRQSCNHASMPSPYSTYSTYSPIYLTGDLARWLKDGNIEFFGRMDHQVKIRGFRIEPEEIETRLSAYPGIKDVVVLVREGSDGLVDKYLCAYIVGSGSPEEMPGNRELRDFLSHKLPDYMIPAYFIFLEKIPLNPNGKVDRKALPHPETACSRAGETFAAPANELQTHLAKIWSQVLSIKKENIGIDDDFFALGGHSLKATVLLTQIHKELDIKIPLTEIFVTPTIRGLEEFIKRNSPEKFAPIEPGEKKEYYPLSSAQKRIYILQQLDINGTGYNIPQHIVLKGEPDRKKIHETFMKLIHRHESLRTWFQMLAGEPIQRIQDQVEFEIEYHDLSADEENYKSQNTNYKQITNKKETGPHHSSFIIHHSFIRPFDLSGAPLLRVGIIKLPHTPAALRSLPPQQGKEHRHILLVDMHHIISDGLSIGILIREFLSLVRDERLPRLRVRYSDYVEWQHSKKEKKAIKRQEEFWMKEFEGEIPLSNLPIDFSRPRLKSFAGSEEIDQLDWQEVETLNRWALEQGITGYMLMLAIFNLFLSKICNQEDIIVGTPTVGRGHADLQGIIGMFVNTLAMRNFPGAEKTFKGFLNEIKQRTLQAFENQDYPFEDLVENLVINRDTGRNALFSVFFALQESEDEPREEMPGPDLNHLPFYHHISKFDITLTVVKTGKKIYLTFQYSTALFKRETIKRFIMYFKRIVSSVLKEPKHNIGAIEIILPREKKQVLYNFNSTGVDYTAQRTVIELFERQAGTTPDYIALVGNVNAFGVGYLSYQELNKKSNQLAGVLIEKGIQPDTIVGIMVERSLEMIVGILAILRAGGAYLPIEPGYPRARKRFLIEDSRIGILLLQKHLIDKNKEALKSLKANNILPFDDQSIFIHAPKVTGEKPVKDTASLAYIIYTSGTSGNPKGVMIRHRSLSNLVSGLRHRIYRGFSRDGYLKISLMASYMFDASIKQIFAALTQGYGLCIVPGDTIIDGNGLIEYYRRHQVDISDGTPTHLRMLLETIGKKTLEVGIKHFIIGGEALPREIAQRFLNAIKTSTPTITNIYGTAECCVDSTLFRICKENVGLLDVIPIGKPMPNCRIYIRDRYNQIQPPGIPGEICIAGTGVGRGYLNRPELTCNKFHQDLWDYRDYQDEEQKVPGKRIPGYYRSYKSHKSYIYHTGDLGRWLPDGNIEYLGRIDSQVKVRGYRIELAEVERRLLNHNKINDVVVLAKKEPFTTSLCAYLVLEEKLTISELRKFLADELPEYMIPSYFISIKKIPLTSNGKLDIKALDSYGKNLDTDVEYAAPGTDMEKIIAEAWQEVLQVEKVSIHDNFFEIGGNSLKIIQLNSKLQQLFKRDIRVVTLFNYTSVSSFAQYLSQEENQVILKDNHRLEALKKSKKYKMQRLQKRKSKKE
ncbi:MAG: amino acid adenylation domain-containing protein [Candidatus Aminicenantes bacterium]|jgi:amino acid adenylation domain-containing protein